MGGTRIVFFWTELFIHWNEKSRRSLFHSTSACFIYANHYSGRIYQSHVLLGIDAEITYKNTQVNSSHFDKKKKFPHIMPTLQGISTLFLHSSAWKYKIGPKSMVPPIFPLLKRRLSSLPGPRKMISCSLFKPRSPTPIFVHHH